MLVFATRGEHEMDAVIAVISINKSAEHSGCIDSIIRRIHSVFMYGQTVFSGFKSHRLIKLRAPVLCSKCFKDCNSFGKFPFGNKSSSSFNVLSSKRSVF